MIKFFRKIRHTLILENKTSKYIKYAIGEILLIIIGILIALSVSEWNSNRKNRITETKALTEIYKTLQSDQAGLERKINYAENRIKRITTLDSLLNEDIPTYTNSMDTLFGFVFGLSLFFFDKTNYEDLKANGLSLIKSDSLRQQLISVYENTYDFNEKHNELDIWVTDMVRPYYLENFHNYSFGISATPINYNSLWADTKYKSLVNYRLFFLKTPQLKNHYMSMNEEMEELIKLIENYIEL